MVKDKAYDRWTDVVRLWIRPFEVTWYSSSHNIPNWTWRGKNGLPVTIWIGKLKFKNFGVLSFDVVVSINFILTFFHNFIIFIIILN